MVASPPRELTLYVQSKKAVTNFYRPPARASPPDPTLPTTGAAAESPDEAPGAIQEAYFLSDDQARALALTEEVAGRRLYTVRLVDVGKAGRVEQFVTEHLRGVQRFPVLIGLEGQRLEGADEFTEDRLCEMMPTEMRTIRAFTYIKVQGGDLDRIRRKLETFGEVKELHFLTGDWDIFVVLEFPDPGVKRRGVLDFVTERIRGIPEVLDTSTLVPEYSLTKFPLSREARKLPPPVRTA